MSQAAVETPNPEDLQSLEKLKDAFAAIRSELAKVIIGQEDVIEQLLISPDQFRLRFVDAIVDDKRSEF